MLLSSLISLKMLSIIMIDGTKCVSDWMIHRRGPSCDQLIIFNLHVRLKISIQSGESSILSLASGPQPAHVTTECDRLLKQCVVLARLCSALESNSFCLKQLSCTVVKTVEVDRRMSAC